MGWVDRPPTTWGTRGRANGAQCTSKSCVIRAALVVLIERPGALGSRQAAALDPVALGDVLDRAAEAVRGTRAETQRKITRRVEAGADGKQPGAILAPGEINPGGVLGQPISPSRESPCARRPSVRLSSSTSSAPPNL